MTQKKLFGKIAGCGPLALWVLVQVIGTKKFLQAEFYQYGMPDLSEDYTSPVVILGYVLSVLSVAAVFWAVFVLFEDRMRRMVAMVILVASCLTRGMMGLSATIYASSFRTFTPFLFGLLVICLLWYREMVERGSVRGSY